MADEINRGRGGQGQGGNRDSQGGYREAGDTDETGA